MSAGGGERVKLCVCTHPHTHSLRHTQTCIHRHTHTHFCNCVNLHLNSVCGEGVGVSYYQTTMSLTVLILSFIPLYFTDCNFLPRERLSSNVIKLTYNLEKLQLTWEKTFLYYLDDGGDALQCCWNENYNNKHWEKLSSQNKLLLSPAKFFFLILLINIIIY